MRLISSNYVLCTKKALAYLHVLLLQQFLSVLFLPWLTSFAYSLTYGGAGSRSGGGGWSALFSATSLGTRFCSSTGQCRRDAGEVCWWRYDGCPRGQCVCDPRTAWRDSNGACKPVRYGNDLCAPEDKCPDGMSCQGGSCQCDKGIMSSDRIFCLHQNHRLIGESCQRNHHICIQRSVYGYTTNEVTCSESGVCACERGFKQDYRSCRRWVIGERGCTQSYHCEGGALCLEGKCACPSGYVAVAKNTKCAAKGAVHDLSIHHSCDENNERRYCAVGLVCHDCGNRGHHTCVKYVQSSGSYLALNSASSSSAPSLLFIVITSFHILSCFTTRLLTPLKHIWR